MKPSSRPAGIALLAAFLVFVGLLSLMLAPATRLLALDLATGLSPAGLLAALVLNGLLDFLAAWGLWTLRPWGRWLALLLALLGMAPSLVALARWLLAGAPPVPLSALPARLLLLAFWAFLFGYLLQPGVRQAFRRSGSTPI
ncbi:MAG TPA: hypothetical protein VEG08_13795 [Terriglobales bacterium]|nr:hypothetical protein [Terriglobales bacterium]